MANINLDQFDKIVVLDFGSQYNQLITRRIRDFGIYSELLSHQTTAAELKRLHPKGIIFSGGRIVSMMRGPWTLTRPSLSWGFRF